MLSSCFGPSHMIKMIKELRYAIAILSMFASTLAMAQNTGPLPVPQAVPQLRPIEGVKLEVQADVGDSSVTQSAAQSAKQPQARSASKWGPTVNAPISSRHVAGGAEDLLAPQAAQDQSNSELNSKMQQDQKLPASSLQNSSGSTRELLLDELDAGSNPSKGSATEVAPAESLLRPYLNSKLPGHLSSTHSAKVGSGEDPTRLTVYHFQPSDKKSSVPFASENGLSPFRNRHRSVTGARKEQRNRTVAALRSGKEKNPLLSKNQAFFTNNQTGKRVDEAKHSGHQSSDSTRSRGLLTENTSLKASTRDK